MASVMLVHEQRDPLQRLNCVRRLRTHAVRHLYLLAILLGLLQLTACDGSRDKSSTAAPRSDSQPAPAHRASGLSTGLQPAGQIRVDAVRTADVPVDEVVAPGRVGMNPNRTSRVLLPVGGRVTAVLVRLGDAVERGQPVLTIESPDADAAIAGYLQAQAVERQTEATRLKAEADYQRTADLYEHRAVAEKDLIAARNDLAQARAAKDTAVAAREQASRKLALLGLKATDLRQQIRVRAPISGKVLDISVAPGEYRNDTSTPLMTISDLTTVWMSADIPETLIRLIHAGDAVSITLVAYPGETFSGRVTRIADVLDPQTRTVKVHVELPNHGGRLRPEMFGTLRRPGPKRVMPVVPLSAVVEEYGKTFVFVERGAGRFDRREIRIGARTADVAPVLDGVNAGDRVVVDGAVLLKGQ